MVVSNEVGAITNLVADLAVRPIPDPTPGSVDITFDPGNGATASVRFVAAQPDGKVVVAGEFNGFDGEEHPRIIRLNSDGSIDDSFKVGSGPNESILGLFIQPDGKLLISGKFTKISGPDALEATEAIGGPQEPEFLDKQGIDHTLVSETLQTGLFTEQMPGGQTWRHQSYAEFLAADYLVRRGLSSERVVSVLTVSNGATRRIAPQLEEVACWAALMKPELFDILAVHNADVLLRCESLAWDAATKRSLVTAYLGLVRNHQATNLDWPTKHNFAKLKDDGLSKLLRPVIANTKDDALVRETAIDIAGFAGIADVGKELVQAFYDPNDVFRVRKHAGHALEEIADDSIRRALKERGQIDLVGDIEDDLKGQWFRILWPSHLRVDELLPIPAPKRKNFFGTYRHFLEYDLPASLGDTELPAMLKWLEDANIDFDILESFGYLPPKIFGRALSLLNYAHVGAAVVSLLKCNDYRVLRVLRERLAETELTALIRLSFWRTVVQSDLNVGSIICACRTPKETLLVQADLRGFLDEYLRCCDNRLRDRWRELIFSVFWFGDAEALELLCDVARTDEAISINLARNTSWPILPDDHNWRKQNYLESKEDQERKKSRPGFHEQLERALSASEAGDRGGFCRVYELLDSDPEDLLPWRRALSIRISDGKAWKSLSADMRRRIRNAGMTYLQTQVVSEDEFWDADRTPTRYYLLNPLLVLLLDENREALDTLSPEVWEKWIAVFVRYAYRHNAGDDAPFRAILQLGKAKAEAKLWDAVERHLTASINDSTARQFLWLLDEV